MAIAIEPKAQPPRGESKAESQVVLDTERQEQLDEDRGQPDERQAQLDQLAKAFKRVFRNLRRLRGRDTHLACGEVSHAQFELLIELYEHGPLSAGELASAAQLTPATVTQMLDHLSASGHVERARSETDRRIVVSSLTVLGRRKVQRMRMLWHERWEQALADIDGEQLQLATLVLDRLAVIFDDATIESCPRG